MVIDQWRRPMREYATEHDARPASSRGDLADDVTKRRWLIGALQRAIPRERAVIVLRHYFDVTEADVARELNLSLGTVKSLNSRGAGQAQDLDPRAPPQTGDWSTAMNDLDDLKDACTRRPTSNPARWTSPGS